MANMMLTRESQGRKQDGPPRSLPSILLLSKGQEQRSVPILAQRSEVCISMEDVILLALRVEEEIMDQETQVTPRSWESGEDTFPPGDFWKHPRLLAPCLEDCSSPKLCEAQDRLFEAARHVAFCGDPRKPRGTLYCLT